MAFARRRFSAQVSREPEREPEPDNDGNVDVDLSEPEEDDDDEGEPDGADEEPGEQQAAELGDEQQQTRREKKRSRWLEHKQRAEEAERRAADERAARVSLEQSVRFMQFQQAQHAQQQNQPDPIDVEIQRNQEAQDSLIAQYNTLSVEQRNAQHAEFRKKSNQLQQEQTRLFVRKEQGPQRPQGNPQLEAQQAALRATLTARHPDVFSDQQATMNAVIEWEKLRRSGAPDDWSTVDRAVANVRTMLKMPGQQRPAPTEQERQRLTGTRQGSGVGAAGPRTVRLSKIEQAMARKAFPHLKSDGERFRAFAKEKLYEEQQEQRTKRA